MPPEARKGREDDAMLRKTIYALISALLVGVVGHFMTIGKVQTVAEEAHSLAKHNRNLIEEYKQDFFKVRLIVQDTKSDVRQMIKNVDTLTLKVDEAIKNQHQIMPVVNQAQSFMTKDTK